MKINHKALNKVLDCLIDYEKPVYDADIIEKNFDVIDKTLKDFKFKLEKKKYEIEDSFVRYYFYTEDKKLLKKVRLFADDVQIRLGCTRVRAYAVPEKNYVCFEVINPQRSYAGLKELLSKPIPRESENGCYAVIGKSKGKVINANLTKTPRILISGSSGSGKSVLTNGIILSLSARYSPKELNFLLIDPKGVELTAFDGLPHLIDKEIIRESEKAVNALDNLTTLMDERYITLSLNSADNIDSYNETRKCSNLEVMPKIIVVIDEFADLIEEYKDSFERVIYNLAVRGKKVGIYLILSTQLARKNVITNDIRECFSSRIALKLGTALDSRLVLDEEDAERLLGWGDLLYKKQVNGKTARALAGHVSTKEIKSVVSVLKEHYE